MTDIENPVKGGNGKPGTSMEEARRLRAFGEDLMDRGEMMGAAETLTRALILFLQIDQDDEVKTTELLLTKVVPDIGPFAYAEIRRTLEIEMGVRSPDPPEGPAPSQEEP